jgi:hypothetical protein
MTPSLFVKGAFGKDMGQDDAQQVKNAYRELYELMRKLMRDRELETGDMPRIRELINRLNRLGIQVTINNKSGTAVRAQNVRNVQGGKVPALP